MTDREKLSEERLREMLAAAKHGAESQTSARYRREERETVSVLTELLELRSKSLTGVTAEAEPVHSDDLAVDRFAAVMKAKLAKKRGEGRGGWDNKDECSPEFLSSLLHGHVIKGDPVDVANLAMMLHQRGETILATPNSAVHVPGAFAFTSRVPSSPPSEVSEITDEMVERSARAVCCERGYAPDEMTSHHGPRWRLYAPHARAALTAALSSKER